MKKVLKRIGITAIITIVTAICLVFIGMAYLFLYPKGELFGIVFIRDKGVKVYTLEEYSLSTIDTVSINTKNFDVTVVVDDVEQIVAYVRTDISGFTLKKNSKTKFITNYDKTEEKLIISTEEPSGWIGSGDSLIKILIPKKTMENKINLNISTDNKSEVVVDGNEIAKFNDLDIKIDRGEVFFDELSADNITLSANRGSITAGAKVVGETNYMALSTGRAHVDLLPAGNALAVFEESEGVPDKSLIDYKINNLQIKSSSSSGYIRVFNCGNLYTEDYMLADGRIDIYYLDKANFSGRDAKIEICKKLENLSNSSFVFSRKGGITVETAGSVWQNPQSSDKTILNVYTNSGNINISGSAEGVMVLETKSGNISIANAKDFIDLNAEAGTVEINFAEDAILKKIDFRTYCSKIKISGVDTVVGEVDQAGEPVIELNYNQLKEGNVIKAEKADLLVVLPEDKPIALDINCKFAYLEMDVGTGTVDSGNYNKRFELNIYGDAPGENKLILESSGKIKLISKDIYEIKK